MNVVLPEETANQSCKTPIILVRSVRTTVLAYVTLFFFFYCCRTALHIACASGHVEVVHFLVESKAKLNLCDNQNRSALMKVILDDAASSW